MKVLFVLFVFLFVGAHAYDVAVNTGQGGTGCHGTVPGNCNSIGKNGMTCFKCDPQGRDHHLPAPYGQPGRNRDFVGCDKMSNAHKQHYCAHESAYPKPTTTRATTAKTSTKTTTTSETTSTTTSITTTTARWKDVTDTCAWTCQEPGGCGGCPHHQGRIGNCNSNYQNCFRKDGDGDIEACEKDLARRKQEANCASTSTTTTPTGECTHVYAR